MTSPPAQVHFDAFGHSNPLCGQVGLAPITTRVVDEVTCLRCRRRLRRQWV